MKKLLPIVALAGAAAGFVLRRLQLGVFDAAGLIPRGDKVTLALYLVCAAAAALVLIVCLREPRAEYGVPAGKTPVRGVLVIVSALLLLASYLPPEFAGGVKNILPVLAFAAACAMAVEGVFHLNGTAGSLLGGCLLPVYLAGLLISDYRAWSYDPQVYHFAFQLLFIVAAMLAAYHLAAFRVGAGKRRATAFFVFCAVAFAGAALADGGLRPILRICGLCLYLCAELWPYLAPPAEEQLPRAPEETAEA